MLVRSSHASIVRLDFFVRTRTITGMAQKTFVSLLDDLDGESEADETVEYALDGVTYEIDLTTENAEACAGILAPYVAVARRTGGRRASGGRRSRPGIVAPARARRRPARAPELALPLAAVRRSRRFERGRRRTAGPSVTAAVCPTTSSRPTTPGASRHSPHIEEAAANIEVLSERLMNVKLHRSGRGARRVRPRDGRRQGSHPEKRRGNRTPENLLGGGSLAQPRLLGQYPGISTGALPS